MQGTGGTISFDGAGQQPGGIASGQPGGAAGGSGSAGSNLAAYLPTLTDAPGGGFCIIVLTEPYPTPAAAAGVNGNYSAAWGVLLRHYTPCANTALPPPSAIAASWWQVHGRNLLVGPQPRIVPGYALVGKLAYLEAGTQLSQSFGDITPLGTLDITAKGRLFVDWGDGGGPGGPYSSLGGPWPTGDITHAWDNAGHFTVTVEERWTAQWSLGGDTGDLTQLSTVGSIPAFEVRQLESIRNR
ncbi:MAG: hypothetical protein ACRD1G_09050 [Acidimicrobiales bacterium]